jgi:hypothetical protein
MGLKPEWSLIHPKYLKELKAEIKEATKTNNSSLAEAAKFSSKFLAVQ